MCTAGRVNSTVQPLQGDTEPSVTQLPAWGATTGTSPAGDDATGSGKAAEGGSAGQQQGQQQDGAAPGGEDEDDDDYDDDEDEWCTTGKSRNAGILPAAQRLDECLCVDGFIFGCVICFCIYICFGVLIFFRARW